MALMSYAASSQAARFMLSHPAHWVAMGFGSGLSPWAPGTVGTLWAWASFLLMSYCLDTTQLAWVLTAALPLIQPVSYSGKNDHAHGHVEPEG